jgi:hypothetical protein
MPASASIFTGSHREYRWLTSSEQHMGDLVRCCLDLVLNRHLVVTAIDAGAPSLTETQQARGWKLRGGMAYSPSIVGVDELFYQRDGLDTPGFDEWYVFAGAVPDLGEILKGNPFEPENAPRPGRVEVFVGWLGFSVDPSEPVFQTVQDMFWRQMDWIQPDAYISDGRDHLTVVCRDKQLLNSVEGRLRASAPGDLTT